MATNYGAEQIHTLSDRQAVQERPGMYIGSTSVKGINQLIYEIADNSIDEYVAGFGKEIDVTVKKDGVVTVIDRGRGIPVGEEHLNERGETVWTLTEILTTLHCGGKFAEDTTAYGGISSGLHGVGSSCVCFLSEWMEATIKRDGHIYWQRFEFGIPVSRVEIKGETTETGTEITYKPNKKIFKQTILPDDDVKNRLNELALLNKGLTINYVNEDRHTEFNFYYEEGIIGYVKQLMSNKIKLYDDVMYMQEQYTDEQNRNFLIEIAFCSDNELEPSNKIKSFANNINTYEGGFHLQGFKTAYKDVMNDYAINNNLIKEPIEMQYMMDGLYAVINMKLQGAEFEGQTKTKLGNAEAKDAVMAVMNNYFLTLMKDKKNKGFFEVVINRALKTKEAEIAARKARSLARSTKKMLKMSIPGKLADCSNKNGYRELFLVEGNSAAGSSKSARDSSYQAILSLRGKLLNVNKAELEKILKSDTITNIFCAIGGGIGENFDVNNVRYDKVILMCDADVDGSHISSLILTLFYYYMPDLIKKGKVYRVMSPLYRIVKKDNTSCYLLDDVELNEYRKKHKDENYNITRMKGLGEMNPEQLSETSLSPLTRTLKRIVIGEAEQVARAFEVLMGKNVLVRREFIENNSFKVDLELI